MANINCRKLLVLLVLFMRWLVDWSVVGHECLCVQVERLRFYCHFHGVESEIRFSCARWKCDFSTIIRSCGSVLAENEPRFVGCVWKCGQPRFTVLGGQLCLTVAYFLCDSKKKRSYFLIDAIALLFWRECFLSERREKILSTVLLCKFIFRNITSLTAKKNRCSDFYYLYEKNETIEDL